MSYWLDIIPNNISNILTLYLVFSKMRSVSWQGQPQLCHPPVTPLKSWACKHVTPFPAQHLSL